jgi:hypothetical protein
MSVVVMAVQHGTYSWSIQDLLPAGSGHGLEDHAFQAFKIRDAVELGLEGLLRRAKPLLADEQDDLLRLLLLPLVENHQKRIGFFHWTYSSSNAAQSKLWRV